MAFGMESGSQRMLDAMCKKTTVEMNARAIVSRRYKMLSHSSWIIGYPGETPESVAETFDFIRKHRPSTVNLAVLRPYPNTEAYEIARSQGSLVGEWHPDADEMPWVRLPWAPKKEILDNLCRRPPAKVYFTPHYARCVWGPNLEASQLDARRRDAGQEFWRSLRGK